MMTTREIESIRNAWQQGTELWYDGYYREAMDLWEEALSEGLPDEWKDEDDVEIWASNYSRSNDDDDLKDLSFVAPLLVFLAGCYLDATEYRKARRCCRQSLRLLLLREGLLTSDLFVRTINEHMAAYEEDPEIQEPWKLSHRLVKWVMDRGCTRWNDPYQRAAFCYPLPALPSSPVAVCKRDSKDRPAWCDQLEEHAHIIGEEFWQLYQGSRANCSKDRDGDDDYSEQQSSSWPSVGDAYHREGRSAHDASVVTSGDWKELVLFGSGGRPELAPRTSAIVQKYASSAVSLAKAGGGEVIFSVLAPHTRLSPHCASTNIRWTAHLGLVVPSITKTTSESDDCRIRIADQWHHWQEGKVLVFDDSYEHEVRNDTDEFRAVLLLRFWHPSLGADAERTKALQQALAWKQDDQDRRFHPPSLPLSLH